MRQLLKLTLSSPHLFVGVALLWWMAMTLPPGRFPHTDDAYFKEPAYNLATRGVLASPAFAGYYGLQPDLGEIFAAYQPLYVYAYRLWISLFPHSLRSAIAFDSVIHLALIAVLALVLPRLAPGLAGWQRLLVLYMCLLLGHPGRPDEMAMIFGYLGLAGWLACSTFATALAAGVLMGLCGATSLPVLLHLGLAGGVMSLFRFAQSDRRMALTGRGAIVGITGIGVFLLTLSRFYMRPGAWAQYSQITSDSFFSGVRRSMAMGSPMPYLTQLASGIQSSYFSIPLLAVASCVALCVALRRVGEKCRGAATGALCCWFFTLIAQPGQYLYSWFILPLILAVGLAGNVDFRNRLVFLLPAWLLAVNPEVRAFAKAACLPPEQRAENVAELVMATVPKSARVVVSDQLYFPLRSSYPNLRSAYAGDPGALREADYCIFCPDRLLQVNGVWVPAAFPQGEAPRILHDDFELRLDRIATQPPRIAGFPIGSQPVGYGPVIYSRKTRPGQPVVR